MFAAGISSSMASQLQTELGPTLTDLRQTMAGLTTTVSRLEQNKQESVIGQIRELTDSLERSLRETLGEMGRQFQAALTGSTKDEFGQLAGIIQGSAGVVEQMNANFAILQGTLQTVVQEARKSTTEQMTAGVEQTQRLNALVEGLMVRLNESANQNYSQMSSTLTTVVTELSTRVTKLSEDLVQTVTATAERTRAAASETIDDANNLNATSQRQLNELLEALQDKSARFDKAGETLLAAQGILRATLDQNNAALTALGAAASEVKTYTMALAGVQRNIEDGQKAQTQVALLSRESVGQLVKAADSHREFLNQYRSTFEQYRGVFEGLDGRIGEVLEVILERQQQYNRSVEQNFKSIVDSANNVMPRMAGVLKASTDELKEHLDELTEVLEKGTNKLAGARTA
jgi:archaellum component FlaC